MISVRMTYSGLLTRVKILLQQNVNDRSQDGLN